MKTVSWQSVVLFGIVAIVVTVTSVKAPLAVSVIMTQLGLALTWVTQGPRSRSTGQSLFPPNDGTRAVVTGEPEPPEMVPQLVKATPVGYRGTAESIADVTKGDP